MMNAALSLGIIVDGIIVGNLLGTEAFAAVNICAPITFLFSAVYALIGIAELWAAIPAGIALNLHPVLNGFASMLGGIIGILLVAIIGNRLRDWLLRNKNKKDKPKGKIYVIWEKYGVVGLGILAPVLTGALLGTAIGMTFGVPKGRLIMWMSIGVVLWSIVLTTFASLGFAGFEQIVG